ncbi:MAG: hypothetical protein WDZ35_14290 [Crocinitomicaceae bacterium]
MRKFKNVIAEFRIYLLGICCILNFLSHSQTESVEIDLLLLVNTEKYKLNNYDCSDTQEKYQMIIKNGDDIIFETIFPDSNYISSEYPIGYYINQPIKPKINSEYQVVIRTKQDSIVCFSEKIFTNNITKNTRIIREIQFIPIKRFHPLSFPEISYSCGNCHRLDSKGIQSFKYIIDFLKYECHSILTVEMNETPISQKRFNHLQKLLGEKNVQPERLLLSTKSASINDTIKFKITSYDYGVKN